jgi:2',3'-cyclic-nucleotide 2'-phosphodiesterase (5'-nucleotidase family)
LPHWLVFFLSLTFVIGCKPLSVVHTSATNINTAEAKVVNTEMVSMIQPYKVQLDEAMEVVLATLEEDLIAEQPESTMGNHVAEITFWKAKQFVDTPVDFAISNFGGMRIPFLGKGPLKVKDAYQIMPFDNYVVVMTLPAATVQLLADKMAEAKGWPAHQLSYEIKEGKAIHLKINGLPLDSSKEYTVALTDYLRDAIMDFWKNETAQGKTILSVKDGRVKLANE